jgi:hypothetical protein
VVTRPRATSCAFSTADPMAPTPAPWPTAGVEVRELNRTGLERALEALEGRVDVTGTSDSSEGGHPEREREGAMIKPSRANPSLKGLRIWCICMMRRRAPYPYAAPCRTNGAGREKRAPRWEARQKIMVFLWG